jgi:hypothetical protein
MSTGAQPGTLTGTPQSAYDNDDATYYGQTANGSPGASVTVATTFTLASPSTIDSLQLITYETGGGGGPTGGGTASVAVIAVLHTASGGTINAYTYNQSGGAGLMGPTNTTVPGQPSWVSIVSVEVRVTGGGGGSASGGGTAQLFEVRINASGSWASGSR